MLIAMRALKDQAAAAYELSEKRDCERRLYKILELYEAQQ
jgi:hypothetical protein